MSVAVVSNRFGRRFWRMVYSVEISGLQVPGAQGACTSGCLFRRGPCLSTESEHPGLPRAMLTTRRRYSRWTS